MSPGEGSGSHQDGQERTISAADDESIPACQSCRRRKLKCSREMPSCSQCSRLSCSCVYDLKRQPPGLKKGAVDALSRRIEVLEKQLLQQRSYDGDSPDDLSLDGKGYVYQASLLLVKELQRMDALNATPRQNGASDIALEQGVHDDTPHLEGVSRKRKRSAYDNQISNLQSVGLDDYNVLGSLPPQELLDAILDTFFTVLRPWIPCVREARLRSQLIDPVERPKVGVLLHAMVSATMRFVDYRSYGVDEIGLERQVQISSNQVLLIAMDGLSVENLQALVILAFDRMGSGKVSKAWPIIGSLTRTVEYLQLTVEPAELEQRSLLKPLSLLENPRDWADAETRRRVFWNIFILDRFCSVTTGWNTSLTSDDVHRQLPCDGWIWAREEPVVTPYFGIWDKSAAKIGNSIAYIPAHYPSPDTELKSPGVVPGSSGGVDTSKLGAFAYCIEATESLSQVTTFFLQQKVDFGSRQEVGSWLTRFKELDLRLVHWKMFLPQKWKDSNISRDESQVSMDPNLTLAHITHNSSMILLHQHIAYPPPDWTDLVKLPSSCSAETCQLAAVETASISHKYLKYTETGILNSQFAFCIFVAARSLLVHWRIYETDLLPEFFGLIESLQDMSRRWSGYFSYQIDRTLEELDIAGKYAVQLQEFHDTCMNNPNFGIEMLGYRSKGKKNLGCLLPSLAIPERPLTSWLLAKPSPSNTDQSPNNSINQMSPTSVRHHNMSFQPQAAMYCQHGSGHATNGQYQTSFTQQPSASANTISHNGGGTEDFPLGSFQYGNEIVEDELTAMSNMLLGQQFLEMDRVITLDGTNFAIDMSDWGNIP